MWIWLLTKLPFLLRLAPAVGFARKGAQLLVLLLPIFLALAIWWQDREIRRLGDELADAEGLILECRQANETNVGTILELQRANRELAAAVAVSEATRASIQERATRMEAEARNRLLGLLKELEDLKNANASCQRFFAMDVGAMCPDAVRVLREHAAGTNSSH